MGRGSSSLLVPLKQAHVRRGVVALVGDPEGCVPRCRLKITNQPRDQSLNNLPLLVQRSLISHSSDALRSRRRGIFVGNGRRCRGTCSASDNPFCGTAGVSLPPSLRYNIGPCYGTDAHFRQVLP